MTENPGMLRGRTGLQASGGQLRVALLAFVLPVGGLAEGGGLHDLDAEHRALHAGRGDLDAEQVEDFLLGNPEQLLAGEADQLVSEERGRGGRDRAALSLEGDLR